MSITSKTYDLFAWRNNNIAFLGVSQENNAKQIVCNLYTEDINHKLLTSQSSDYDAYIYVKNNFRSARVQGTVDKTNSKVSFDIANYLVPDEGCYSCFIALIHGSVVIKFGGMKFIVLDGVANSSQDDEDIIINNGINLDYILQFIYQTVPISDTKEFKLLAKDIAPSSPVYVTIKARATTDGTVVRSDGEDLVDVITGNVVDSTMTQIQITSADVIAGIKGTESISIRVEYYSRSCENILQLINNSGGQYFVQTTYQQRSIGARLSDSADTTYQQQLLGSSLSSPTSTTYETSGGGTIVG